MSANEYRQNVEAYLASLNLAKKFLAEQILTEEEFETIKTRLMEKYHIECNSIFSNNELI